MRSVAHARGGGCVCVIVPVAVSCATHVAVNQTHKCGDMTRSAAACALMQCVVQGQGVASHGDTDEVGGYVLLRPLLLPLLQAANLAASNTKKLATLVREHVLAPFALHTEPRAPSRNSFHAGVSSQAQKCAVVGL